MNELFDIPPSSLPKLTIARQRLAAARAAWKEADEHEDESGEAVPQHIIAELELAKMLCANAELEATK